MKRKAAMNIDVHAHYVLPDSLKVASEIGRRHGLKLEKNERGTRHITHSRMALEYLVATFGADHVLLGSDYPYDMGDPEPVATLAASGIASEKINRIASANACKLLRIGI